MQTPPSNATKLAAYLKTNPHRYFCQSCLSSATGVKPTNQVNQIVRPLGQSRDYRYTTAPCATCGKDRECILYCG